MIYRLFAALLMLICLATTGHANNEVYKTTDQYGNVIYSDAPIPTRTGETTEKVRVRDTNTMPSTPQRVEPRPSRQQSSSSQPDYQVRIVSPTPETSVPPGQRDLIIAVSTALPLPRGAMFAYYMNGELLGRTQVNNYSIREIIRGAHSLEVKVESETGELLSSSEPVTVYVHRASIR